MCETNQVRSEKFSDNDTTSGSEHHDVSKGAADQVISMSTLKVAVSDCDCPRSVIMAAVAWTLTTLIDPTDLIEQGIGFNPFTPYIAF